jgi:hypothetical protein
MVCARGIGLVADQERDRQNNHLRGHDARRKEQNERGTPQKSGCGSEKEGR